MLVFYNFVLLFLLDMVTISCLFLALVFEFTRSLRVSVVCHPERVLSFSRSTSLQSTVTMSTLAAEPITHRLTKLMVDLWGAVAFPGDGSEVSLPLSQYALTRKDVRGLLKHFQSCKDCAADNAFLMATQNSANEDVLSLCYVNFAVLGMSHLIHTLYLITITWYIHPIMQYLA
jgi:hypothetical protein